MRSGKGRNEDWRDERRNDDRRNEERKNLGWNENRRNKAMADEIGVDRRRPEIDKRQPEIERKMECRGNDMEARNEDERTGDRRNEERKRYFRWSANRRCANRRDGVKTEARGVVGKQPINKPEIKRKLEVEYIGYDVGARNEDERRADNQRDNYKRFVPPRLQKKHGGFVPPRLQKKHQGFVPPYSIHDGTTYYSNPSNF